VSDRAERLARLHAAIGYKPLNRTWAKLEIGLGLLAAGIGLLVGQQLPGPEGWIAGLALFVLGGYLALAGHRSHLYQSNNELIAYLADELRTHTDRGHPS
jgi:hypothetical protein